jgi:putative tricarboxylic transport membrane protein
MTRSDRSTARLAAVLACTLALVAGACGGGGGGAYPSKDISFMAPAAPGGGWDSTARAIQKVIKDAKVVDKNVEVYNVEGAGGTVGLAQFVEQKKGDPHEFMVMGLVMVGAIRTNKAPVDLSKVTPIASLTTEWEAIAVAKDSEFQTLQDLITAFKADPKSISWGGGSAGGTDHILVGLIAKAAGVDPKDINYIPHSGGGELTPAILSKAVSAGVSGVSEFSGQVESGDMRLLAVSSDAKVEGVDAPTIKESGLDVVISNWRGVMGPPELTADETAAAIALIDKMHGTDAWKAELAAKGWTDFFKKGDDFKTFLTQEQTTVEGVLKEIGLIQ